MKDRANVPPVQGQSAVGGIPFGGEVIMSKATPEQSYAACGTTTAQMTFMLGMVVGGEEWKPSHDESVYMATAWTDYFRAKGIKDLPPGVVVATALISYAGPRLFKPNTQTRIKMAGAKLKAFFNRRKKDATQSDSGNDGIGKIDSSDGTG